MPRKVGVHEPDKAGKTTVTVFLFVNRSRDEEQTILLSTYKATNQSIITKERRKQKYGTSFLVQDVSYKMNISG